MLGGNLGIIGPQIDHVMTGQGATWHEDHLVPATRHGKKEDVWWTYSFSPIDDESNPGGVGGVLVVCNDVTERHRMMDALRSNEERLQLALEAGVVGTWDWHIPGDRVFADERFARLYGVDVEEAARGAPIGRFLENVHPDDCKRLTTEIGLTLERGSTFSSEYRLVLPNNDIRWVLARGYCLRDEHGKPSRFPGAVVDITERKKAEEHGTLLTNEMNHRVKNTLATVQAIASQTLRSGVGIDDARSALNGRLQALSNAHDLLTGEHWAGAELAGIIATAASAYAPIDSTVFQMEGPAVLVSPRSALAFSMALHELCTNAAKYGALSSPDGRVCVTWQVDVSITEQKMLQLRWAESGGPPVKSPTHKGFGSRLIDTALAAELGGEVRLIYEPQGVICTIRARLAVIQEEKALFRTERD